ncbi:MAG: hypothetical protein K6T73_05895 [Candidatus Bathyarchaeota archaeon]|nr:hypothetical protein [Candidatus Bathyarchaeota archaeon]
MKAKDAAFLSVLLVIVGLGFIAFSVQVFESRSIKKSYSSSNVWTVTGYVEKGDVIAIDLKASYEWGTIIAGEEVEIFPAEINITVVSSNGESVNLTCRYEVFLEQQQTPILSPQNVSLSEASRDGFLDVNVSGPLNGFLKLGRIDVSDNLTIVVSQQSVWENFLSTAAPKKLTLSTYEIQVERPYIFLLPAGLVFVVSSVFVFLFRVRRRVSRRRVRS